jgi:hypothetical protein
MLYNSDSFVVVRFDVPSPHGDASVRGGFELVDKVARKEIFIEGALAQTFKAGVEALVEGGAASPEMFDEYIAGFAALAQQPLMLH